MSLAQALSTYLSLQLFLLIGVLGLGLFSFAAKTLRCRIGASHELRLHYLVLLIILGLTAIHPLLPKNKIFSPAAKVWSAQSIKSFMPTPSPSAAGGYVSLPTPSGTAMLAADQVATAWLILAAALLSTGCFFIAKDLFALWKIRQRSLLIRQIGRVQILVHDGVRVPFSFWLPGQANVVIPSSLIERRQAFQMAVAHELQHHRHHDTQWVYLLWGLRLACIANPAIHGWSRWLSEIQEFACDETLVDRKKVELQAYTRCLVEVAKTALGLKTSPVCATGLGFWVEGHLLKRRIEKMLAVTPHKIRRPMLISIGFAMASVLAAAAWAANGLVQDRRVSMERAQEMAAHAGRESKFPVAVNDLVLQQLNRYLGTPEGRDFMKASLARLQGYKATVGSYLKKYDIPDELLAMPIVESGYQNLTEKQSQSPLKAAGLWQFIPATAKNYGLRVDGQKDERLDIELNTDAAMRLLSADYLRFKDWQLSVLAYNMGESAVQKGIEATGSRNAWTLIGKGYEGDKDYLPKLMAAILIMRNPESVQ